MDGAGGIVKTLAELAALGVADQRIEGGIPGKGRPRRQSGGRECGDTGGALEEGAPVGLCAVAVMRFVHGVVINTA